MDKSDKERVNEFYQSIQAEIEGKGYYLNPDRSFVDELLLGLLQNNDRYGYPSCPCRLSAGIKEQDMDLICPCDYRDDDLAEFGACYCALYVDEDVWAGLKTISSIPERRKKRTDSQSMDLLDSSNPSLAYPVYRCKVCGYLMAKDQPPSKCPICGVSKERFERFM